MGKGWQILIGCLFLLTYSPHLMAQNESLDGWGVESNLLLGRILKHTPKIKADVPSSSFAVDWNFFKQTLGDKDWHARRGYPTVGLGVTYLNYGADFGSAIGVQPNLEIPILRSKKLDWIFRIGFGLGYSFKAYERAPSFDTLSNALGSHLNNFSLFATHLRYHLSEHWDVQLGANFNHLSNAALRLPNYGINMYGLHLGIRYAPNGLRMATPKQETPPLRNRWLIHARYGMAWNEYAAADGPLYNTFLGAVFTTKRWHSKNKLALGVDASYHQSIAAFQKNNGINVNKEKANSWKGAAFIANEFLYGRAGIWLQLGVYWKHTYLRNEATYQKLGLNYYFIQKEEGWLKEGGIGIFLKTHKANAELAEVALSVAW